MNYHNTSFYDKLTIDYSGSSTNNYTHINIFETSKSEDLECYKRYKTERLTMCHLYFQDSFENFILSNKTIPLLNIHENIIMARKYVIFENSLSKKDIGFYDQVKVDWINTLNYKLQNFEDYQYQRNIVIAFFILFTTIHIVIFVILLLKRRKLKMDLDSSEAEKNLS